MKYEDHAKKLVEITEEPDHDRIGRLECGDLFFVANRNWIYLLAHDEDYFVRTDNPILLTGFIERPDSCLFYPLSPKVCFVACSMPQNWSPLVNKPNELRGYQLTKGDAFLINFYLARSAGASLIISPDHDGKVAEVMFGDVLGKYPQPPFSLHALSNLDEQTEAFESIRIIMSTADGLDYPSWSGNELEPYYGTYLDIDDSTASWAESSKPKIKHVHGEPVEPFLSLKNPSTRSG